MDLLMMKPELPAYVPGLSTEVRPLDAGAPSTSFSKYLEQKITASRDNGKDLLGVALPEESMNSEEKDAGIGDNDILTVPGLLQQLMEEIQKIAKESGQPGQWTFVFPDSGQLEKVAAAAGMTEAQISPLIQQMEVQGGKLALDDFLAAFNRHFEAMNDIKPITVPETNLPLLETLLSKMGIPTEEIARISNNAVVNDGTLDLTEFLKGLETIKGANTISLTDWEAQQLKDLLAEAGVSEGLQNVMFWERGTTPVELGFDRLKNLFSQGINEIEMARPRADLPAFMAGLKQLFTQAGFEDRSVGLTPVVQETLQAVHEQLVKTVDISTVGISAAGKTVDTTRQALPSDQVMSGEANEEPEIDTEALTGSPLEADSSETAMLDADEAAASLQADEPNDMIASGSRTPVPHPESAVRIAQPSADVMPEGQPGAQTVATRMPPQLQQQAFEQVSQGVLKGLNNNDHHLVLKLHPPELGEVKVDLLVRDDHVALSFVSENSRVKQLLESSLNQFQQNLEDKGFVLTECLISSGGDDDADNAWQRFAAEWNSEANKRFDTQADLAHSVLYGNPGRYDLRDGGISLFV